MAKILLGCLIGVMPQKAIIACHSLLYFIYLAQYSTHDNITLGNMQDVLDAFRQWHGFLKPVWVTGMGMHGYGYG
jgi:hypothetical protein